MTCTKCKKRPATSPTTGICSVCLYEQEMGLEATLRQTELANREREREKAARAKPRTSDGR